MRREILLFGILFIGLIVLCRWSSTYKESFFDFPDQTKQYISDSQTKYAGITNIVNLIDPSITVDNQGINSAVRGIDAQTTSTSYQLTSIIPERSPNVIPPTIKNAKSCETAPNTCAAFDDPTFAANCGMSFDVNGTAADGSPHKGGLYLSPMDRQYQTKKAADVSQTGSAPYDPYKVYQPTLGTAKKGTFGITKDSCIVVKEKVDCASKQNFGSPHCSQCYTSGDFARVGPETGRLPSTLYLIGSGSCYVWTSDTPSKNTISHNKTDLSSTPISITIPANTEGTTFVIAVSQNANTPSHVAGYIEGPTPNGAFKLDMMNIIHSDSVTGAKPRISGTTRINGVRCINIIPGSGKSSIKLSCLMPFTFLNMYDGDALTCDNGPILTKESSATFLESDPCFGKANQPGNYKLECLQSRWTELGGTDQGTGYPSTQKNADTIQKDANGNPLDINTIVDNLSIVMTKALTGKDINNTPLSIPDWNTVSMYATGVPINTPCDGPGAGSQACATYIYRNQGTTSHIGPTYSAPSAYATKKEGFDDVPTIYNQSGTALDPNTPSGAAFAQQFGTNIAGLKQAYDTVVTVANDNKKKNTERAPQLNQAYNIVLPSATPQRSDFDVRIPANQPTKNYADMKSVCESKGMRLCQSSELCDSSRRKVTQPELTASFPGDNWIAVGDQENEWLTLNRAEGRYCKTHTEVAGGTPGWSGSREPSGWERLAKCCSGNATILGRYISIGYNHTECLNLAQIAVYSDDTVNSNMITPQTVVTKSSGYQGDAYPVRNFVDGVGNTFVHTSCGDTPWIQVDLGAIKPIQRIVVTNRHDCCKERVLGSQIHIMNMKGEIYVSNPITSVSDTYTVYPPDKTVYGNVPNGSTPQPRQKVYGNNGTTTCERYCSGVSGGPWNNELPVDWNGARCDDVDSRIGNCYQHFEGHSGAPCTCVKTGTGWRRGGWAAY